MEVLLSFTAKNGTYILLSFFATTIAFFVLQKWALNNAREDVAPGGLHQGDPIKINWAWVAEGCFIVFLAVMIACLVINSPAPETQNDKRQPDKISG